MYSMKTEHLLGWLRVSTNEELLTHAINNVNETEEAVIQGCKQVELLVRKHKKSLKLNKTIDYCFVI